jgi:transposase InsO family protein
VGAKPDLDRLSAHKRADLDPGAAAVRPRARGPGSAREQRDAARADDGRPILVAWSDNGTEMTATHTRQFMALMAIAQHHGRPGTPTDQGQVESFFSHLKATGRTSRASPTRPS